MFYKEEILKHNFLKFSGNIIVLGSTDTGKSTFTYSLYNYLKNFKKVSILDLDVGQNSLDPPSTQTLYSENLKKSWFIGSFSPVGNFLDFIVGAKKLAEESEKNGFDVCIVDTTGFIDEKYGAKILKHSLFDILSPSLTVALQKDDELENFLYPYEKSNRFEVIRIEVSKDIKIKTKEYRRNIKKERLKKYFENSFTIKIDKKILAIFGKYEIVKNQLISFLDKKGFVEGLGVIKEINNDILVIRISKNMENINSIKTSKILLDEDFNYSFL